MTTIISGDTGIDKVQDGSIGTVDIAAGAVTQAKLETPLLTKLVSTWVNFDASRNSSGGTDSANTARYIRGSSNVTSVTKTATGRYTVAFTSNLADANYACVVTTNQSTTTPGDYIGGCHTFAVGSVIITCQDRSGTAQDTPQASVIIVR